MDKLQSILEQERKNLAALAHWYHPSVLTEQSSVCEQSVRSLSSEHARIAKEQTAKAIANTADAYEKNGVEAALCEVGAEPWPKNLPLLVSMLLFLTDLCFSHFCEVL